MTDKISDYMRAPFPYFGGKSKIADEVWRRFGDVRNYVEPFFGSGATLLRRPQPFSGVETVNDLDGMVANFWRAVKHDAEAVAEYADWPVNENDLHARHAWLVERRESLCERLEGDPEYHDAKIAGWWCWGMCSWIGGGFCGGKGPWRVRDGRLTKCGSDGVGVSRRRPELGNGSGIHRKDVNAQGNLHHWFAELSARLRRVRVCCGDWMRVLSRTPTTQHGLTAVFLDPPYADTAGRDNGIYTHDSLTVAHEVREWAIANGENPDFRIALCGYDGEHKMPDSWECFAWKANACMQRSGGSGKNAAVNRFRERVWFSPHCLRVDFLQGNKRKTAILQKS